MKKTVFWLINVAMCYAVILIVLKYFLSVSIHSYYTPLFFSIIWVSLGTFISKLRNYEDFFSPHYAPFSVLGVKFCSIAIIALSFLGGYFLNKSIAWDLAWCIVPTIPITLVLLTLLPFFKGTPYLRILALLSTLEVFLIMALVVVISNIDNSVEPLFPPKSTMNGILIIFCYISTAIFTFINVTALKSFDSYQTLNEQQDLTSKLSHKRKLRIATHEAAKVLMYCYFEKIPTKLNIYLYEKAMNIDGSSLGMVVAETPKIKNKDFLEWKMLLNIAGNRGDVLIYGNQTSIHSEWYNEWYSFCHEYLSEYFRAYTANPSTAIEIAKNKEIESKILKKQIAIVDDFLKKNKGILLDIAKQAMAFHSLESHHLEKHFNKIQITRSFPTQRNSFSIF